MRSIMRLILRLTIQAHVVEAQNQQQYLEYIQLIQLPDSLKSPQQQIYWCSDHR